MSSKTENIIPEFKERLKQLRKEQRLNQSAFGEIGGVSTNTQSTYESGDRKPDVGYLLRLQKAGLDVVFLLTGHRDANLQAIQDRLPNGMVITDLTREIAPDPGAEFDPEEYAMVPVLNIEVSAGSGRYPLFHKTKCHNAWRKSYLRARGLNPKNLHEMLVVGDSMEPVINDGDYVLVDKSQRTIGGGSPFVLRINDEMLVKYIQRLPGGQIQVSSANSAAYPAYTVSEKDVGQNGFEIWGRVVRSARDW